MGAQLDRVLIDRTVEEDEQLDLKKKAALSMVGAALLYGLTAMTMLGLFPHSCRVTRTAGDFTLVVSLLAMVANIAAVCAIVATRKLMVWLATAWAMGNGVVCLFADWAFGFSTWDLWALEVIVMDALLAFGSPTWSTLVMLALTVGCLMLRGMRESSMFEGADVLWGWGAVTYDIFSCITPAPAAGNGTARTPSGPELHAGEEPVSNAAAWSLMTVMRITVFVLDYFITRSFAVTMFSQFKMMKLSLSVTQKLAVLLAKYEVEQAQDLVESEECSALPPQLRDAFRQLLANLKSYKAFLPLGAITAARGGRAAREGGEGDGGLPGSSAQVLPQLRSTLVQNALQCTVSRANALGRGAEMNVFLAERGDACIAAGDLRSAHALVRCGWDAPTEVRLELADFAATMSPAPRFASGMMGRQSTVNSAKTGVEEQGAPSRPAHHGSRFEDGVDAPGSSVAPVALSPPGYVAPAPLAAVESMSQWHSPKGETHWPSELIADLIADCRTCLMSAPAAAAAEESIKDSSMTARRLARELRSMSTFAAPPKRRRERNTLVGTDWEAQAPLYAYTVEINRTVVWARWLGARDGGWKLCANQDAGAAASAFEDVCVSGDLPAAGSCLQRLAETDSGLRFYGADGHATLLRYENTQGGRPDLSPLRDTAAWAPAPESLTSPDSLFSLSGPAPPPPGVLEFITSRGAGERIDREDWSAAPLDIEPLAKLREACMAQKNQQRPKESICQMASAVFFESDHKAALAAFGADPAHLISALRALYRAKCPSQGPSPAQIAHAAELTLLRWRGRDALLALTGEPRCAAPVGADCGGAEQLWRVDDAYEDQPFYLMNAAMRHQQSGARDAELQISPPDGALLYAGQPAAPPPAPAPARFDSSALACVTAAWAAGGWRVSAPGRPAAQRAGELRPRAWGLPQYRALIWRIDAALRDLPAAATAQNRRKGYRGLAGVVLDRRVYSRGRVVVFGAFTSTSDDQGVAAGFAAGDSEAAIFTMFGHTGRCIAPWSRFAREKEVLYPPNTLHLVTEALSSEHAAILGKAKLQVFDLREVSEAEAVGYLAREGATELSGEHPEVLQLAVQAARLAERGDWVRAARELLAEPHASAAERQFALPVRPMEAVGVAALLFTSPAGQEIGAGVDPVEWSAFFERAEGLARKSGARLMASHVGALMLQVSADCVDGAALAAVSVAIDLLIPALASPAGSLASNPLKSPTCPGLADAAVCATMSPRSVGSLRAHCGVAAGTVHSGFAGSSAQRIEIADGPAVRRARTMAAYALRFGLGEVVIDASCAAAADREELITWRVDLIAFDSSSDLREPIACVAPVGASPIPPDGAAQIEEAWAAVADAADGGPAATSHAQDCVMGLGGAASVHRAARALAAAAAAPATYCCELEGSLH